MNILLATCGSRGDVQPLMALALGLIAAGHRVTLAGPPEKAAWARGFGCTYVPAGRDVTAFVGRMEDAVRIRPALSFISFVRKTVHDQFRFLPDLVKGHELAIGAGMAFGLSSVAQAMEIPYRYLVFSPHLLPSDHHPFIAVRHQTLPARANRLTWILARAGDRLNMTGLINRYRQRLGLAKVRDAWDHILGDSPLVACDPSVFPVPGDVRKNWVQTGYLHLDQPRVLHPDLERFLADGDAPVYAGFGSMPPRDQEKIFPLVVEAVRQNGRRVVLGTPGQGNAGNKPGNPVFRLGSYPHLHLFPEMAALIHHGGAGTTAAGNASGIPQVIVPHILDQYYHGHGIHRAGMGPAPVWRSRLTRQRLATALAEALASRLIRAEARQTAKGIDPRAGVRLACKELLRPFAGSGRMSAPGAETRTTGPCSGSQG